MRSILWTCDKDKLAALVARSKTFSEIIQHFGFVVAGPQIRVLKKRLDADSINYSHIPQGLGASRGRVNYWPKTVNFSSLFSDNSTNSRKSLKKHILLNNLIPYVCAICGQNPVWCGKPLTLVLDHENGKRHDNRLTNIRFLCPNCNSQTATFGSRNIKVIFRCSSCGIEIAKDNTSINKVAHKRLCDKCKPVKTSKIPDAATLARLIWEIPTVKIAELHGVSDKAVSKWCTKYNISKPGPGYWRKIDCGKSSKRNKAGRYQSI